MNRSRLRTACVLLALVVAALVAFRQAFVWRPAPNPATSSNGRPAPHPGSSSPTTLAADTLPGKAPLPAPDPTAHPKMDRAEALAKVAAFTDWLTMWRRADSGTQPALVARGTELAAARRAALKHLIELDPQAALEHAVPVGLRAELPSAVEAQLERRIDDRGDYELTIACFGPVTRLDRAVVIGGQRLEAFVYGRRLDQTTKVGLPVHGIAIDNVFAFAEAPYRLLDDAEKAARGIPAERVAVAVGKTIVDLAGFAELDALRRRLVDAESRTGPQVVEAMSGATSASAAATASLTSPASWINGTKRVLWLKIDFTDDPGAAFADDALEAVSTSTSEFYAANGQGKTTFTFTILPSVLRMPKDKAYYSASGSTNNELYTAAHDAAKAYDAANGGSGGWDPDKFDRYIIVHKRIPVYLYGGVAQIGGPRVGINNQLGGTIGHELGHTQSLYHSHFWAPSGTSAVGAGAHVEYGDVFDRMGSSSSGTDNHFNVSQKTKLGYLDAASVTTITQSGTYRLARHDHKDATGVRGLRIAPPDLGYDVWLEHRRFGPTAFNAAQFDRLRNGVQLRWGTETAPKFTSGPGTYLLDPTPGSAGGASDAAVRIGETFVDPDVGFTVKPLAVGGSTPNEYIDVQISFGATDGNRNPTLQAQAPAGALAARTTIIFNATASDPDGDAVYYHWDFGDGTMQPNLSSITRRFLKGGDYSLRVSAHDGKGGIDAKTLQFTVVDPLANWTLRNSGATTQYLYDVLYAGNRFVAVGINQTIFTSTDGVTWTRATFPGGNSLTGVAHNGARFVLSGYRFSNATQKGLAAYSDDGVTWTPVSIDTGLAQFWGIAYGAGRFVMVGDSGMIYSSVDGVAWSAGSSGITSTLRGITYANGLFVATGDAGRVLTSVDGLTWSNRSTPSASTFYGAAFHNGQWQLRTGTGIYTSADAGVTWTRTTSNAATVAAFKPISVAGIYIMGTSVGGVEFSEEPQTWSSVKLDTTANVSFRSITAGNGLLVAAGSNGLIYTTTIPAQAAPPTPPPSLRIEADSIKVAVGKRNMLSASGQGFAKLELYANGTKVSEIDGSAGALAWTPATVGNYLLSVRGIDASGASFMSASYPAVAAFANWKWRNPSPVGADLHGAVRADGKWWMVGGGGTLATLDDAGNFTPVDFSTSQQLNSIAYANGRFVIATTDLDGATKEDIGGLWTSADGYSWTPFLTGALDSANLNYVLYAANRWIALGTGGTIVTSTDATNWPRSTSGISGSLYGGVAGNGVIVAVGAGGKIITSPDGLSWTERSSGVTTDLRAVTFGDGRFVAAGFAGVILTSTNGTAWSAASSGTTTNLYAAAYVKGAFVVAGDNGTLLTSTNGSGWTGASNGGNSSGALGLASGDGDGLLVGRAGEIYTATTASSWQRVSKGTTDAHIGITYAGGRFVAVGSLTDGITRSQVTPVTTSTDGANWRRATTAATVFNQTNTVNAVTFARGLYVAVANAGRVYTSPDADTWTARTSATNLALQSVATNGTGFLAVGASGTVVSSDDGSAWTARTSGVTQFLRAVAYGNGKYVAVGDGGVVITSTDGATWTAGSSGVTANLLTIGWWEDVGFIAAGNNGTMLGSADGVTWQVRDTGVAENIGAIAKTAIGYVAAGGVQGTVLVSVDGFSWSLSALPADKTVRSIAASPNAIVAVGDTGVILTFELVDATPAPLIVAQPASRQVAAGEAVRLSVSAQNATGAVYQWMKDNTPIVGANSPVYRIAAATSATAGAYTVTITTATGSTTSFPAVVSLGAIADPGRLINLSIRTALASATDNFTFGFVIGGGGTSGTKSVLVRAVGPSLAAFGVTDALEDPKLEFFSGTSKVGENDNWGGVESTRITMAQVGAFPLAADNSRDAVLALPSLATGSSSAIISGRGPGSVLAELYDATPAAAFTIATPRLINVSVRKEIGGGVIAGFVIGGSTSRTVLLRAIGPTLGVFGVTGAVTDPRLALFSGATQIGANDNWGGTAALSAAFGQVGAFTLASDSKDAALLVTLQPNNYTVQVSGVNDARGSVLIEVYEVPE